MVTPAEQFVTDLPKFFDTDSIADTGDYVSRDGLSTVDNIVVGFEQEVILEATSKKTKGGSKIHIRRSDVDKPAYHDRVIINGQTWYIVRILRVEKGVTICEARTDVRSKFN